MPADDHDHDHDHDGPELDEDGYPVDLTPIETHIRNARDFACEYDCNDHPWPTAVFAVVRELEKLQAKSIVERKKIEKLRDSFRAQGMYLVAAAFGDALTILGGANESQVTG